MLSNLQMNKWETAHKDNWQKHFELQNVLTIHKRKEGLCCVSNALFSCHGSLSSLYVREGLQYVVINWHAQKYKVSRYREVWEGNQESGVKTLSLLPLAWLGAPTNTVGIICGWEANKGSCPRHCAASPTGWSGLLCRVRRDLERIAVRNMPSRWS